MSPLGRTAKTSQPDVEPVIALLAAEFDMDEFDVEALRNALTRNWDRDGGLFEFILDNPIAANWRLKHDPSHGPFGLRVSDYGNWTLPERQARAKRLNEQIQGLLAT